MEFVIYIGAFWPLVLGLMVFAIMTRRAIIDGFINALNKRLDSEAWLENFLNYANTFSTLGAVVAGAFGIAENSHITTALAVSMFIVFYRISFMLRIRQEALKDRKEHELAEKIVKALVAELEKDAGSA
jgi:hypothetical protein